MATLFTKVITSSFYENYFFESKESLFFKVFNTFLFCRLNYFIFHKKIQKK